MISPHLQDQRQTEPFKRRCINDEHLHHAAHYTAPVAWTTAGIPGSAGTSWASAWGWSFSGGGPGIIKVIKVHTYGDVIRTLDMV